MAVITRGQKGSELEHNELDNNFVELDTGINALTASLASVNNSLTTQSTSISTLQTSVSAFQNDTQAHPYYHFHGFAGDQAAGDGKFFCKATAINHGVRGDNLSDAQMFTTPGYVTTIDPVSGTVDTVIRIPSLNFDYIQGEKLIVWWLGKALAEGSQQFVFGDGYSTTVKGWGATATSAQKLQLILSGATQGYSGTTTATPFDGNLHDVGFVLDGAAKKYALWVDGAIDPMFSVSGYLAYTAGVNYDIKSANTVNIGSASPKPGGTSGIAVATRAFVMLRLPASYPVPSVAAVGNVFKQLRTNPGKLILASAL